MAISKSQATLLPPLQQAPTSNGRGRRSRNTANSHAAHILHTYQIQSPTPQGDPEKQQAQNQQQQLDLSTLTAQQLLQIKKQLDEELTHLNQSFTSLRGAQIRFGECVRSIELGVANVKEGTRILVPLTTSLYLPGVLADREKVLVDVGDRILVEMGTRDAMAFYEGKTKELGENLKGLESILNGKAANLRIVEDVLRQKVAEGQRPATEAK